MSVTMQLLESDASIAPDLRNEFFSFHEAAIARVAEPVLSAWQNPLAREKIESVLYNGMFKNDVTVADTMCAILDRGVARAASESDILTELRQFISQSPACSFIEDSYMRDEQARINRRVRQVTEALSAPQSFLDIGCGSGTITAALAHGWGIAAENAIGLEVADRVEPDAAFCSVAMDSDGGIPAGITGEVALLLMVLHHEAQPEKLLAEIYAALPTGGTVFIRDHDAADESSVLFLTAFDRLYYSVLNGCEGVPEPANYRSLHDWLILSIDAGFAVEKVAYPEPDSPMSPVHIVLKKPAKHGS